MNNLLLITDVARLRNIFGQLADSDTMRLRIVNDLEKGGEEIAIEKPDVVFVQTHLSGLSADILLMHLKKQLGRKRARFVLLASPGQTNEAILKLYHGWLDTSAEDGQFLSELEQLLETLLSKPKIGDDLYPEDPNAAPDGAQRQFGPAESSMEEQGLTYAPRQRMKVSSEFGDSFDSAVSRTPEPASLDQTAPTMSRDWINENIDPVEARPTGSKKGTYLLWMIAVVIIVVGVTYYQHNPPAKSAPDVVKIEQGTAVKPASAVSSALQPPAAAPPTPSKPGAPDQAKEQVAKKVALTVITEQDRVLDKDMLDAIAGKKDPPPPPPVVVSIAPELTTLPRFIPVYGHNKSYSATHPGWELYLGNVTEFKVLKEADKIKAIQVIDRGWRGLTDPFLKRAFGQLAKNPSFGVYTTEKREGYKIQRGRMADNVKVVYYREEKTGVLRAFALTWQ